jgi:hypothetical protein
MSHIERARAISCAISDCPRSYVAALGHAIGEMVQIIAAFHVAKPILAGQALAQQVRRCGGPPTRDDFGYDFGYICSAR